MSDQSFISRLHRIHIAAAVGWGASLSLIIGMVLSAFGVASAHHFVKVFPILLSIANATDPEAPRMPWWFTALSGLASILIIFVT